MVTHKYIDRICVGAALLAAVIAAVCIYLGAAGIQGRGTEQDYETRLFDSSRVHKLDIKTEDWEAFLRDADKEQYVACSVEIDGELFHQVGLRAKGNNSRRLTTEYGLSRYSLKLEFDQFSDGGNYYGLDKFSLDASFQDNSYLKTWLAYDMMNFMGVPAPLCSYVWVTVNGQDWGLFLAVEEPEESFARRNFGLDHGQLYKPDYRSLGDENKDVALRYVDDDPESYPNIFDNAKFNPSPADKQRLIRALEILSSGENLEQAVDIDEVLRYFTVQVFVMNWDSYLGPTGHNYFLYEENGVLSILPWDYNLAFGTYALGMSKPIKDPAVLINYPVNTPAEGTVMLNRPLYHNLMKRSDCLAAYHKYFERLLEDYFDNRQFEARLRQTAEMIAPYVKRDPTAFCSYEDHLLAADVLEEVCLLRAESIRAQLNGQIPITLRGQNKYPKKKLDTSHIHLEDLGDFEDLKHKE